MIRISATLGLVMTASTRVRQSGRCSTRLAPAVCNWCDWPAASSVFTVEFAQQGRQVVSYLVDHIQPQGFAGREADSLAHGLLRPIGIAPAQLRQAADVRSGIVDLLAGQGFIIAAFGLVVLGRTWGPPICTGVAAPRLVPGAIAATWLA